MFTTRGAGLAADGDLREIDAARALELLRALGLGEGRLVTLRQVHGDRVVRVQADAPAAGTAGDALVTGERGHALCVRVADCVPVLLARADGRRVAAVHAGWRGLVAGVVPRAVEALGAGELWAAIGPCLSARRFEVGPEVAAAFESAGLGRAVLRAPGARAHVDLRLAARAQLEQAGVARIDCSDRCTWDDAELFSHRRDVTHGGHARAGHQAALIARS